MTYAYRGSGHPGAPVDRNPGAAGRIGRDRPESLRERLTGVAWIVVWEVVRRIPEPVAFGAARAITPLFRRVAAGQRAQLRRNLARVTAGQRDVDLDELVTEGFASYARYFVEAFRAGDLSEQQVHERTTTEGFEHLDGALARGKGAIVLLAHHGSWDVAARWAECHGYHLAVVAEVVRPRALFEKFVRLREAVGLEVVPLHRGGDVKARLTEVLAANHLVGLLSDRDLSAKGPIVELFGEPSRIPAGPVQLARRTGAAIVPVTMLQRPGRRWHVKVLPEIDVTEGALADGRAQVAGGIESLVCTDPAQWHVLSPVWLADVPPHRRGRLPDEVAARLPDRPAV